MTHLKGMDAKAIAARRMKQSQALIRKNGFGMPVRRTNIVKEKKVARATSLPSDGLTVQVPQGLGDIFWVYQKLAPHFTKLYFQIALVHNDPVSRRSEDWLQLLPKCGGVSTKIISHEKYEKLVSGKFLVKDVLRQWQSGINEVQYSCNRFLEEGVRLDQIDDYPIAEDVEMTREPFALPFDQYIVLYVSGNTNVLGTQVWSVAQWFDCLERICKKFSLNCPVVLIGASFDQHLIVQLEKALANWGWPVVSYVQAAPARICYLLQRSKLFIGYQSGLNIIADNFDVPQIMVYFDRLKPMMYTWCKRANVKTRFHAGIFSQSPEEIVEQITDLRL
jgi:hypothetical protein